MARQVISMLLVALHVNLLLGCSSTRIDTEMPQNVQVGELIVGAVLVDGTPVSFDEQGGYVVNATASVIGRSTDGTDVALPSTSVREFRLTLPDTIPPALAGGNNVREVLLSRDRKVVTLESSSFRMVREKSYIIGTTPEREEVVIPMTDVLQLRSSRPRTIPAEGLMADTTIRLAEVITVAGRRAVTFDSAGGRYRMRSEPALVGRSPAGEPVRYPLDRVLNVNVSRTDPVRAAFSIIGVLLLIVAIVAVIAAAAKESCPFVYSFDGAKYVFDAEPLGGAVSRGLTKTDLSRLEHLRETDGSYRLLLKNEVRETQYLDELKLVLVDHDPGIEVFPDAAGRFRAVHNPVGPVRSSDERGQSLQAFVGARDQVCWQTKLPPPDEALRGDLRHTLSFDFVRPPGSSSARLLFRGGTALWGSHMIREMLALRGDRVADWYADVDRGGPELYKLAAFVEREQLYVLDVMAETASGPQRVGVVSGGGPLIYEDRAIDLDLSKAKGDTLRLSVRPPFGFWGIDYVGMEFGGDLLVTGGEVSPVAATDHTGKEETAALLAADGSYSVMEAVGDWMEVAYPAPPVSMGLKRSVFLKTSGYYNIHLPKGQPEQTAQIREIMTTPGKATEFAMQRLAEQLHAPPPSR